MPQITIIRRIFLPIAVLTALFAACGTPNDQITFDENSQSHAPNWVADHDSAGANSASCTQCHGEDLSGGISKVSCSACHMGGPTSVHPLYWAKPIALNHSGYVELSGTAGCDNRYCHGSDLLGGTTGPSCTKCHIGGPLSAHPIDWAGQISTKHGNYVEQNTAASCRNIYCHGANLEGIAGISPACNVCHAMPEKIKL